VGPMVCTMQGDAFLPPAPPPKPRLAGNIGPLRTPHIYCLWVELRDASQRGEAGNEV
jgi:hypothetical protein